MKTTGEHIVNMIKTMKGEHCLFRSFGMDETDKVGAFSKSALQIEVSKWFPDIQSVSIERTDGGAGYIIRVVEG